MKKKKRSIKSVVSLRQTTTCVGKSIRFSFVRISSRVKINQFRERTHNFKFNLWFFHRIRSARSIVYSFPRDPLFLFASVQFGITFFFSLISISNVERRRPTRKYQRNENLLAKIIHFIHHLLLFFLVARWIYARRLALSSTMPLLSFCANARHLKLAESLSYVVAAEIALL